MSQMIQCPHCGFPYQLTPEYLSQYGGMQTVCTQCQATFSVPRPEEMQAAAPVTGAAPVPVLGYAGPRFSDALTVWREGNLVVARDGSMLITGQCFKCNAPSDGTPVRRTLYWHASWLYFMILFPGLLIYAIVALIVRQKGTVYVGVCQRHRQKRLMTIAGAWLGVLVGGMMIYFGASADIMMLVPVGILTILVSAIIGTVMAPYVKPRRIERGHLWLSGAGPEFLDSLPTSNLPRA